MSVPRASRIYSGLLRLYPRHFRDEYGIDMTLLFAQQLRDEPTSRVWARSVVDLVITIPARHLEAHVHRSPNPTVAVLFAAVSISGLALGILGGSSLGILGFGLVVAVVAGGLAVAAWRNTRGIAVARPASERWWQVLLVGIIVLATTIAAVNVVGEVSSGLWLPMMLTLFAGFVTTAAGLILGVVHRIGTRPGGVPG